jgi:hypothetical protein
MNLQRPSASGLRKQLAQYIRLEVVGLLTHQYIFRTHQEIVRRNTNLQGLKAITFARWAQAVYVSASSLAIRRLVSHRYEADDVSLIRLIDMLKSDPTGLWGYFEKVCPSEASNARAAVLGKGTQELTPELELSACRRILSEDRKILIKTAEKANQFASKRVAHNSPDVQVRTTFSDLDAAIEAVKTLAERYVRIAYHEAVDKMGRSHPFSVLLARAASRDLRDEMKEHLPKGWDAIFLIPWATPETLALPLGEMKPPPSPRK